MLNSTKLALCGVSLAALSTSAFAQDIVQADIGKNADVVGTGGSTITGVSTMELDSSTIADAEARNLKIVGLYDVPGNSLGDFAVVVVKINEHLYGSTGVKAVT